MFERFTDRARRVVVLAQEEARRLGHDFIGTEHLLLGLLAEGEGVGAQVLQRLGIEVDAVRRDVEAMSPPSASPPSDHIPFTSSAKQLLERSLREALALGHNYIGTEHLLLGLARDEGSAGGQILVRTGVSSDVRGTVLEVLRGYAGGSIGSVAGAGKARQVVVGESADRARHASTEGARRVLAAARGLSGTDPMGTHHLLEAMAALPDTAAHAALSRAGINLETIPTGGWDLTDTLDEDPAERAARQVDIAVSDSALQIRVTDDALRQRIMSALREGRLDEADLAKRFGQAALDAGDATRSPAPTEDDTPDESAAD